MEARKEEVADVAYAAELAGTGSRMARWFRFLREAVAGSQRDFKPSA
jgi:hypothetical protein